MPRHDRLIALLFSASLLLTSFAAADRGLVAPDRPPARPGPAAGDAPASIQASLTSEVARAEPAFEPRAYAPQQAGSPGSGPASPAELQADLRAALSSKARGTTFAPTTARVDPAALPAQADPAQASPTPIQQPATRIPIIEYHYSTFYFDGVQMKTQWFVEQLEWLAANGYYTLTIEQLADFIDGSYAPPQRSVALTFDVGISHFDDYRQVVVPTLRRLGQHGIFFVQPGGVRDECQSEFTCWPDLAQWLEEGAISVGSHTITHRDFTTLSPAEIAYELRGSQAIIQRKLGVTVIGVCYPFDSVSPEAFPILESLGYRFAVGGYTRSDRSTRSGEPNPYALPRYYPYSSEAIYPAISGAGGQSFPQLIEAAVSE